MPETGQVIAFDRTARPLGFADISRHLTNFLVQHTLIDSYRSFLEAKKPYPFVEPGALRPGTGGRSIERAYQNTALIFVVDGELPVSLNRHFRLRGSNRVTWRNIQRLAPEVDLSAYMTSDCRFDSAENDDLLAKLLPLDYALLVERKPFEDEGEPVFALTHLHVKVERLTDNAIKDLGRKLGYIERRLFERGEDYVEALENKFYEYYGFSSNASGRKSAAAMAAQLLDTADPAFGVFVASQEDNRLTVLDASDRVTQYFLIRIAGKESEAFASAFEAAGVKDFSEFLISVPKGAEPIVVLKVQFRRTAAAQSTTQSRRDKEVLESWLELIEESIIPPPGLALPDVPFSWSRLQEKES